MLLYSAEGALSKKQINLKFQATNKEGKFFSFPDETSILASINNVVSASRNTVLGNEDNRICFVEHLLGSINLLGIKDIEVQIDGTEVPLLDGSGKTWVDLLKDWPSKEVVEPSYSLAQPLFVSDEKGRSIIAYPAAELKLTYLFQSPINQEKTWTSWSLKDGIDKLANARTFGPALEHEMLGLKGKLLSYDAKGFDLPLYSPDEPALHKLLDLFGDLSLCETNPLKIKAHFVSFQAGHELNTKMAKLLKDSLQKD
jgi:UDP-3-O-[3-hydroxymyristoyl] N-acetylglucosamine deacetylase